MGIQGLLPFLKKIHRPVNIAQFEGCTVAIDAYCWLHKGAFSCADKLALGEKTDLYVKYCLKFVNYLIYKNLKPILVFDGCHLPSKKDVEKTRREKRDLNRKRAAQFLREGKRTEARECLQRSIDISPEMALELMNAVRAIGVDCIVAPYEADAQLAYLNKCGIAQIIITEDSDLLLFGCERVLFKMDHFGNGLLIERKELNEVMEIQDGFFTFDKFRYLCILSGCDYLPSLPGIGLAKACKVFKVARQSDLKQLLKKVPTYLKMNLTVTQEYIDGFIKADNTFLYQLCFDPLQRKLVPLNPYTDDVDPKDLGYAGSYMPLEKAYQIALGNINIYTQEKFAEFDPETFVPSKSFKKKPNMLSIWDPCYRVRPKAALKETQIENRPNLHGKEVTVAAKFKRSPQKRVREAEECKDVKSDTELSSMYGYTSSESKRQKMGISYASKNNSLHFFSEEEGEEEENNEEKTPSKSPVKPHKRLFESLPDVKVKGPCAEEETNECVTEDQENGLKSQIRNRFAVKSPTKKPRFNLNAPKVEVRSRFFASPMTAVQPQDTEFEKSSSKTSKSSPTLQNSSPSVSLCKGPYSLMTKEYIKKSHNLFSSSKSDKNPIGSKEEAHNTERDTVVNIPGNSVGVFKFSNSSQKASDSGKSAFDWSKFTFSRSASSDSLPKLGSSEKVNKQFKKVVSESSLGHFVKPSSCHSKLDVEVQSESNSQLSQPSFSSHASQDSDVYSIDSFCMSKTQETESEELNWEDFVSKESNKGKVENEGSDDELKARVKVKNETLLKDSGKIEINTDGGSTSDLSGMESSPEIDDKYEAIEIIDLVNCDHDSSQDYQDIGLNRSKVTSARSTLTKVATKSGCRVSGLSKRVNRGVKNKPTVKDEKQQKIKDMFSKFARDKRDVPCLKSAEIDLLTDDDHMNSETPIISNSALRVTRGVQRQLVS
ncbi:hypothetical protein CHS0354_042771 [Potamilus streckersoni]|uniref:Exonuclease 1 n=1 Tax=Potamilus streckersoni TaxID=2493646 RepID=A0AAE0VSR6_9BIVA|nr:hypothetical protein CHS0354_042771 [Potamilus streckersoni]